MMPLEALRGIDGWGNVTSEEVREFVSQPPIWKLDDDA